MMGPKPNILIVDDEKTQREGLRAALEDSFEVYLADSAEAAMELLERETFQVLLTDFRMPKEDGMKLVARAKSLPKAPVCILMTAYGSEETAVEAIKRGADDYISKGKLNIDELEFRIRRRHLFSPCPAPACSNLGLRSCNGSQTRNVVPCPTLLSVWPTRPFTCRTSSAMVWSATLSSSRLAATDLSRERPQLCTSATS